MKSNSILILSAFFLVSISCDGQKNQDVSVTKSDSIQAAKNPIKITNEKRIAILHDSMIEYLKEANPSFSKSDVDECMKILNEYLTQIKESNSKDEGLKIVKNTVERLNILNNKCDSQLIETMEREQIADIILSASSEKGYNKYEDDSTEQWRTW